MNADRMSTSLPLGHRMDASMSPLAQALPKIQETTDLQKMLADEKMRAEQHKTNYQLLKAEHTRLQDEYMSLQHEMKTTIEESRMMQEKYKTLLEQLRKEVATKNTECEELKANTITPQRLEILKMELADDLEKPYKEKFKKQDEEVERYRMEFNKLRYEYSFLKSEYDHEKQEHQHVIDEMKLQSEAEITNLRKERESMILRQQSETGHDTQKVRSLQRDNAQLNLKIKGLLSELEEIRAQQEQMGLQSDHVTRMQQKQLSEHAANIRSLTTERDSLKTQCETLQREASSTSDLRNSMTSRVNELEKDNIYLRNRVDEISHKSKMDLADLKKGMLKERGELERERDRLKGMLEDLESKLDITKQSLDQQAAALVEKEQESVRRVQAAREEEWQHLHKVENEKLDLEAKLQEIGRHKIDEDAAKQAEMEKVEERIKAINLEKDTTEKENLVLKTKMQHLTSVQEQLEQTMAQNSDMKNHMHRIDLEYNSLVNSEQELNDLVQKLRGQIETLTNDVHVSKDELVKSQNAQDTVLAQHKAMWTDEKLNLQKRVDELEGELSQLHQKYNSIMVTYKKKKKRYVNFIRSLKDKGSILEAKLKQTKLEKESLKNAVPPDTHGRLKKELRDLMRRHNEFRAVLLSGVTPLGDSSFLAGPADLPAMGGEFLDMERQHQRDLQLMKERLDSLNDKQQKQMQEFKTVTSPSPLHSYSEDLDTEGK